MKSFVHKINKLNQLDQLLCWKKAIYSLLLSGSIGVSIALLDAESSIAAPVVVLNSTTTTATGAGATGIPSIVNLNIPAGKNRAVFVLVSFERDHCDLATDNCTTSNTSAAGLNDNYASPVFVSSGSQPQITARFTGAGGNIDRKNPLLLTDPTLPGDLRFLFQTTSIQNVNNSTFFGGESYYIALYESQIQTLLGSASSGTISITLPDITTPKSTGDDATLHAVVLDNVQESTSGIVRSGITNTNTINTGTPGNFSRNITAFDAGQAPTTANDGLILFGFSYLGQPTSNGGFAPSSGFSAVTSGFTNNSGGNYNALTEQDGMSTSVQFRTGIPTLPIALQSAGASNITSLGGYSAAFTIKAANPTISGTVWNDANNTANGAFATNIRNGVEAGTNAGGALYAILVNSSTQVAASTLVFPDGTYTFRNIPVNTTGYTVRLSTTAGVEGIAPPTAGLPAIWTNTTPLTIPSFNVALADVSLNDFGIDQLPNTTNVASTSQLNPGLAVTVTVPTLAGTDPEDGALGSGKSFRIVNLPTNGTLYYTNALNVPVAVTPGQLISNYDPTKLKLDPNDGAITVTFTYAAVDAAGKEDPTPATVTMPFTLPVTTISISGTVWNDIDGSGNGGFNLITTPSGESVTNAGGGLYAILIDGSPTKKVIGSVLVAADGTYTFTGVAANQTGLTIELSTTPGTLTTPGNTTIPTPGVPTGWKSTANTPLTGTGRQPITAAFATASVDITGKDFGVAKPATVVLVKRITGIKRPTDIAWNRTKNPNEPDLTATPLNLVVSNTFDLANNGNYNNSNWTDSYVKGAPNAGLVLPGDELEYTIYYLNTQGANAKSLKICDPIKGKQTYTPGSMQLFPNGTTTAIPLTDSATDTTVDQAAFYASATLLANCNADLSTVAGADRGGVSIQLVGTNGSFNPAAIPGATGVGTPLNSYGFFRFTTKVNP